MKLLIKTEDLTYDSFWTLFKDFITENGKPEEIVFDYRDANRAIEILRSISGCYNEELSKTGVGSWLGFTIRLDTIK